MTYRQIQSVPVEWVNSSEHRRKMANAINEIISAVIPNTGGEPITGDTTLDKTNGTVFCDTTSAAINVTLPVGENWQKYRIINSGATGNGVTITPNGTDKILGINSPVILLDGDVLIIEFFDAQGWW